MPKPKLEQKMVRMVVPLTLKASENLADRTFEGFAATWDQDLGNDVIKRGAFKDTIKLWKKSNEAMPLLDSHNQFSILAALGQLVDAQETSKGLWTKWEVLDGPEGDAVLTRLRPSKMTKRSIVGKMSIGFFPEEFSFTQPEGTKDFWDRIRNITKAALKEVSLVLFPMNPNASIDAATVKSFALSAENTDAADLDMMTKAELRRVAGLIGGLLTKKKPKVEDDTTDEDESTEDEETPKPPKKQKTASTTPVTKTDLEDAEDEDTEDESTDDATDDAVDDATDEDTSDEESSDDADEGTESTEEKTAAVPIYQYGEALSQRIARLNLAQRLEDLTGNQ